MDTTAEGLDAIIVGAGPAGIAMAYRLKHDLGFHDFLIYEKLDGVGGTWRTNTYPGCGCDLKSHLYSFSFNPNPNWSKELCEQPEILQYMEDTVDKFDIRKHVQVSVECTGAKWHADKGKWEVFLKDLSTGIAYSRFASVFVSAVGAISFPRNVQFRGMEKFNGAMFHTVRWDHSVSYANKRVAVIGNGCSAAQVIPAVAPTAAFVKQYARSGQWIHERPNRSYTEFDKFLFRWVPLWQRLLRLKIFLVADEETTAYFSSARGIRTRAAAEKQSADYIRSKSPEKYWNHIIPDFPLGCKRRIFDPGYLDALRRPNVELLPEGIQEITETGIVSASGIQDDFDLIVLATGFQVSEFLTPMDIIGADGRSLRQQWRECRGAQAYLGTHVHNFPNLAILFGPNTFPANNSALFACETQASYAVKSLFTPLVDRRARVVEVKQAVENYTTNKIHQQLAGTVFAGDCSNWYINKFGRNAASWPGLARSYWADTYFPDWSAFHLVGGSWFWPLYAARRWLASTKRTTKVMCVAFLVAYALRFCTNGTAPTRLASLRGLSLTGASKIH
ncbi:Flavin monooxygenase-like protein [Niveomyces insectorum RCEF 264]|uniref:Flavin monooxygenase-like protein n=1 Tax=Niveomyces insectorum RCEF 264 TaxID=1081102 RepID=A0A167W8D3_9HYPO|nr:Flavin monooxygenase-like protein [Niveomyces insectorum RCEF 264]